MPPKLHDHQEVAVAKLGNGKVLWGGVGTGKSITAVAYYVRNETPRDIYVITTAKKRKSLDWEKEFAAFAIGKTEDSTVAGVLTVDSWNNIGKYTDVRDAFFIFDEQRAVGSGAWADALIKIAKSNRWIMLSATPGDTWLDYIPLFVANGYYKNRSEFIREHVQYARWAKYPKVERYHRVGELVRYKNRLLVEMPYERHTRRIIETVAVEHDSKALERVFKDRWNPIENKPLKDIAELFIVARKLVNSDPSRLATVRSLMETHPRLIVFYNFDYELEMLRTLATGTSSTGTSATSSNSQNPRTLETKSTESGSTIGEARAQSPASHPQAESAESISETRTECQREQTPTPASIESSSRMQLTTVELTTPVSAVTATSTTSSSTAGNGSGSEIDGSRSAQVRVTTSDASGGSTSVQAQDTQSRCPSPSLSAGPAESSSECLTSTPTSGKPSDRSTSSSETATTSSLASGMGPQWSHNPQGVIASAQVVESESGDLQVQLSPPSGFSSTPSTPSAEGSSKPSSQGTEDQGSFALAEWNGHKHQEVPTTDRWVYLVQYTAGAEGWNCITTDTIVFYSLTYSYKMWHQAYGRIDRLNTPFTELKYYILQSNSWIDQAVRKSLNDKKNFNENKYKMSKWEREAA